MTIYGVKMFNSSFNEAVITRLKQAFNLKTDREVSKKLGLVDHAIAQSKKQTSLPLKNIISTCVAEDISLDHIFGNQKAHRQ